MINYTPDSANGEISIKQHIFIKNSLRSNRSLCNQITIHNGDRYSLIEELENE